MDDVVAAIRSAASRDRRGSGLLHYYINDVLELVHCHVIRVCTGHVHRVRDQAPKGAGKPHDCTTSGSPGLTMRIGRVPIGAPVCLSIVTGSISTPVSSSTKRVTADVSQCACPHAWIAKKKGRKTQPASESTKTSRGG